MTCIAFDANERRLLSAANDGLVKIWNFNNGSMLRMYTHDEEKPQEISRVFYVQDEKRGQECVYAAGWNRKIYIWEDMDEVHFHAWFHSGLVYRPDSERVRTDKPSCLT